MIRHGSSSHGFAHFQHQWPYCDHCIVGHWINVSSKSTNLAICGSILCEKFNKTFEEINRFRDEVLLEMDEFRALANNAWGEMQAVQVEIKMLKS